MKAVVLETLTLIHLTPVLSGAGLVVIALMKEVNVDQEKFRVVNKNRHQWMEDVIQVNVVDVVQVLVPLLHVLVIVMILTQHITIVGHVAEQMEENLKIVVAISDLLSVIRIYK